tara:strand:- start:1472 stop:2152 length:681 start_codon:yes stop_codon:yes gene_type:complete
MEASESVLKTSVPDVLAETSLSEDVGESETKSNKEVKSKTTLNKPRSNKSTSSMLSLNIYTKSLLNKRVLLSISQIGGNIKEVLQETLVHMIEGKCIIEGYVKPSSVNIINYSSGVVEKENILFEVTFECLVCFPVEGMEITCVVKDITKAGIRAVTEFEPSPIIVFVARDHHNMNKDFSTVSAGDYITVKVIGQRFELNDPNIFIIAELMTSSEPRLKKKLVISE